MSQQQSEIASLSSTSAELSTSSTSSTSSTISSEQQQQQQHSYFLLTIVRKTLEPVYVSTTLENLSKSCLLLENMIKYHQYTNDSITITMPDFLSHRLISQQTFDVFFNNNKKEFVDNCNNDQLHEMYLLSVFFDEISSFKNFIKFRQNLPIVIEYEVGFQNRVNNFIDQTEYVNVESKFSIILNKMSKMLLIDSSSLMSLFTKYPNMCIAGGSVLDCVSSHEKIGHSKSSTGDVDIWILRSANTSHNPLNIINDLLSLINKDFIVGENGAMLSIAVRESHYNIQIINMNFWTPEEVLSTFDNSACQVAINHLGVTCFNQLLYSMHTGKISWNEEVPKPHRVNKYLNKGFKLDEKIIAVCAPDDDEKVINEQLKSFYFNEVPKSSVEKKTLEMQMLMRCPLYKSVCYYPSGSQINYPKWEIYFMNDLHGCYFVESTKEYTVGSIQKLHKNTPLVFGDYGDAGFS